jgi:hypothetical protein
MRVSQFIMAWYPDENPSSPVIPTSYGLSYSMNSFPRSAWTIGDWSLPASSTNSSCASAQPAPGQNGHLLSAVQLRGQAIELFPARSNLRSRVREGDASVLVNGIGKRDIPGKYDYGNASFRQGRLHRNLKNAWHLRGLRNQFAEVAALLE